MSVSIVKQIIDQRVIVISDEHSEFFEGDDEERRRSKCFLLLGVSAYLDIDLEEAYSLVTDGGQDGGFDAAYYEETADGIINVTLFQSKYDRNMDHTKAFPANEIKKAVYTVETMFDPDKQMVLNDKSRTVVDEIHSLILDGGIPSVTFVMINNGEKWQKDGQECIDNAFGSIDLVQFVHFGYQDILGHIKNADPINADIHLAGVAVRDSFNYKSVIVGKVNVSEIKRLMDEYGDRLLDRNIRRYLGRTSINDSISSCLTSMDRSNFFFYNNGITFICNNMTFPALQEANWIVKMKGLQIINGGQTCKAIHQVLSQYGDDGFEDTFVLVRLYEVNDDEDIITRITYATNHQNPVDLRDLKSNDEKQKLLELGAKELGVVYKRKKDSRQNNGSIPVSVAAEAVFAIWRVSPHLAKYKKGELFGNYYESIFQNLNAAQMIIAVNIFRYCDSVRKREDADPDVNVIRRFGNYFIACLVGQKLLREREISLSKIDHTTFGDIVEFLEQNKERLEKWAEKALVFMARDFFRIDEDGSLDDINGRTMAALFRRYDLVEQYINNPLWWDGEVS